MKLPVESAPVERKRLDVRKVVIVDDVDDWTDDRLLVDGDATC